MLCSVSQPEDGQDSQKDAVTERRLTKLLQEDLDYDTHYVKLTDISYTVMQRCRESGKCIGTN